MNKAILHTLFATTFMAMVVLMISTSVHAHSNPSIHTHGTGLPMLLAGFIGVSVLFFSISKARRFQLQQKAQQESV